MDQKLVNRGVLALVVLGISAMFLRMLLPFLQAIFLAALFAALFTPLYRKLLTHVGNRKPLAAGLTVIVVLLFLGVPLAIIFVAVLTQALDVAETARPWVQNQLATPGAMTGWLEALPFYERIEPYRELALSRIGELAGTLSGVLINFLQSATIGTVSALFSLLIIVYTMFFFLMDGDRLLYLVLYYLPLNDEDETQLLNRFVSVTRATLRGTAVIGVLQGALAGLALYVAGVPSALFWAVVMMFLSVVPGIGAALVWIPAVIWLAVNGEPITAMAVAAFCGIIVGTLDNVLRPRLVGNDAQLHDLMIFFSTLGGLLLFGFTGFIIGPIIAALFVTVWELYGEEFRDWLPRTGFIPDDHRSRQASKPGHDSGDALQPDDADNPAPRE
jgi:predicted PurR-regulated permease PerM